MTRVKLNILGLSPSQSQGTTSFAVVLGEDGKRQRRLPIIIGMFEAQAIAIELENIVTNRPMTHDLFKTMATGFHVSLKEVSISQIKEGVFYAEVVMTDGKREIKMDSRPSDAIALALRFKVSIFASEEVMKEASIQIEHEELMHEPAKQEQKKDEPKSMSDLSQKELQERLEKAVQEENFEEAAKIRDELNKRN